ncbi:ABC transporter ATP-binding protein [Alkalibacterium olivapovliticus]|uniref:ATP-binding cassette subfamily B protein n=1 Tax=Alkalibacterium olivapovliticus TaxID=99907 RepID=A0A2T0W0X4_9LACT|nr:ABC transporter ATP-binding protein [Alkalibacterium olivapovliticus]PRY78658.1 ATP-binding cassette subfamily B protein [Alkalibacterium olivapovliticus]
MPKKKVPLFKVAREVLKYTFICWPTATSFYLLIGVTLGVLTGLSVWVMQFAFDSVTELAAGGRTMEAAILPVILLIVFLTSQEAVIALYTYYMNTIEARMHGFMSRKVAEKTAKLEPVLFEDPQMLDDINKASEGTSQAFGVGNTIISATTLYLPYIIIIAIYLYNLIPLLTLVILLTFATKMVALVVRSKLYMDLEEQSAPLRRKRLFYEDAMIGRQYFKETRQLGIFGFFKGKYMTSVHLLNRETWKADARAATFDLITEILNGINDVIILYLLFHSLQNGWITVGAFAAVLASVNELSDMIEELISDHFTVVAEDLGKISYLIKLFDLPEKTGEDREVNWRGTVEFERVSFSYPNAQHPSIDDVSLSIKNGETVAIVGENGAGKSTFTKLLLGLYEPTSGEIKVDGHAISTVSPEKLYKGVSAVFQYYQRYQLTLEENIRISDSGGEADLVPLMEQAGVDWESRSYPEGTETMLSREFGGIDLSGGQWQRVSIARGLYRLHDLIVLDEPTAAIDPLEESRLYEKFAEISKDKTSVIVTHRLGSAKIADKIVVLDKGKVVETGTHQELLANKGQYSEMYESQSSWYMN